MTSFLCSTSLFDVRTGFWSGDGGKSLSDLCLKCGDVPSSSPYPLHHLCSFGSPYGGFHKWGYPKIDGYGKSDNPIKLDDLGLAPC